MKLNTEIFKNRVQDTVGNEYEVLGEYIDYNYTKIKMRHNICGYEYDVLPAAFFKGVRCAKCGGTLRYTTQTYSKKVKELVGEDYSVLGEYKNNKTKILMKHNICGHEYEVKPGQFIRGDRCPECRPNKTYTRQYYVSKVQELVGDEYSVIGNFVNGSTRVLMKHNKCGFEYKVQPTLFVHGVRCPNCFKSVPYTTQEYKDKVYELVGDRYTLLSEYVNANTQVTFRHNPCGTEYNVKPLMFFVGNRCPKCSMMLVRSLPEEIVAYYISKYYGIIQSFRPEWLKMSSGNNGEIDIWIPELNVGIEYDGSIHRKFEIYNKDLEKNEMILNTDKCRRLIRIREKGTYKMNSDSDKIVILNAEQTISITSKKGISELERLINSVLAELGAENANIKITEDVIINCQNRAENYYISEGLPVRKKKGKGKSNTDEFKKRVYELVGNDYTVLSDYETALSDIRIKHEVCGYEYVTRPNSFLTGRRCPNCSKHVPYSTEMLKRKIKDLFANEYSLIGEYVNSKTKIHIRHNTCGYDYWKYSSSFLAKPSCPRCSNRIFRTTDMFSSEVKEMTNGDYKVLGEYIGAGEKIRIKHKTCQYEYDVVPSAFLRGVRCPWCAGRVCYTTDLFKQKVKEKYGDDFSVLGEYIDSKSKIRIKHHLCGNEWDVTAGYFLNRGICPNCPAEKDE